jgi:outer membrane biosynthesis protein TonB
MSVEPLDSMNDFWGKLQGQTVNGRFRLGRYLGGTDHSGVFLTLLEGPSSAEVALKLVPAVAGGGDEQLTSLRTAATLAHPHLLRLFDTGRCTVDGETYLYAIMEYADQSLGQLLKQRALTEEEVRELLAPTLQALSFLHARNLVQGQLKPANMLAVGDNLKLATDTVRPISETGSARAVMSAYDPPEYRDGGYSTAGDIWGLGMSLLEALSHRPATGLDDGRGVVALPLDFPPALRDLVAQCLSRRPYDRPKVSELETWLRGPSARAAPLVAQRPAAATAVVPPSTPVAKEVAFEFTAPAPLTARADTRPARDASRRDSSKRAWLAPVILAVAVAGALSWAGIRVFGSHHAAAPPAAPAAAAAPQAPPPSNALPVAPSAAGPAARTRAPEAVPVVHAEMPDVPARARQTIRGRIKVSVRAIVNSDGKVDATLAEQPGPSRYFERLAIEAARKWTFAPVSAPTRRVALLRFEFTRAGATGHAASLQ